MANLELGKTSSPVYSYQFAAMISGYVQTGTDTTVASLAPIVSNFRTGVSRILGVVRVTAGGTVGNPILSAAIVQATAGITGYFARLTLASSSNLDTSVYAVYWTNEVGSSQILSVLTC